MLNSPDTPSGKQGCDLEEESRRLILQFGDLSIEANRVRLIEAMLLDHIIPSLDPDAHGLESALFYLPRSTMNELVATHAKLSKAYSQSAALLLKGFQDRDVPQGDLEALNPLFEGHRRHWIAFDRPGGFVDDADGHG